MRSYFFAATTQQQFSRRRILALTIEGSQIIDTVSIRILQVPDVLA
jgi:hypothetical protein